jgi:hypothetical protein
MLSRTDSDRGKVVMLKRLCESGNEQACETLQRLCKEGTTVACRAVRLGGEPN